jgi:hypothetical protein
MLDRRTDMSADTGTKNIVMARTYASSSCSDSDWELVEDDLPDRVATEVLAEDSAEFRDNPFMLPLRAEKVGTNNEGVRLLCVTAIATSGLVGAGSSHLAPRSWLHQWRHPPPTSSC